VRELIGKSLAFLCFTDPGTGSIFLRANSSFKYWMVQRPQDPGLKYPVIECDIQSVVKDVTPAGKPTVVCARALTF
jgi:hypothetical protein